VVSRTHPHPAREVKWREPRFSSNIEAVGWDNLGDVYVRFRGGREYMFKGASRQRAVAASLARSPGRYVTKKIIPNFPSVRVK
jgi:hypothetical protein